MDNVVTSNQYVIWPVLVYAGLVILLVAGMVAASHFLGERHRKPARNEPYESGIEPTDYARMRFGARYYLVAIFFLLFDIEAAIVFGWAVAFREVGWAGYIEAVIFMITLTVGLVYIWRLGGLDWSPDYAKLGARGDEQR